MTPHELRDIIGTLGFPIFVAVWMLYRDIKILREFTAALNDLKLAVQIMLDRIK